MTNSEIVLVADYGRSGEGWLSYMLCYILNASFIEPYNLCQGFKYSKSDHVLSLTQGRLQGRTPTKYALVVKTHGYPAAHFNLTSKVLYLTRDPRDVAVSGHKRHRLNATGRDNKGPEQVVIKGLRNRLRNGILGVRSAYCVYTALRWRRHVLAWLHIPHLDVSYEALSTRPLETLRRVVEYLGEQVDDELLREAIDLFSFERITGRQKGEEDPENPEFRKGVIGDYKGYLSKLDQSILARMCGAAAAGKGYGL